MEIVLLIMKNGKNIENYMEVDRMSWWVIPALYFALILSSIVLVVQSISLLVQFDNWRKRKRT